MAKDPLIIPELLAKVLSYTDHETLKMCRVVSNLWNVEAGHILTTSSWIKFSARSMGDNATRITDLELTLRTSRDPSKFFGQLRIHDDWFPGENLHVLLQTYGRHLKALDYSYWHVDSTEDGTSYCQLLFHRILTQWCPELKELHIAYFATGQPNLIYPIPLLDLNCFLELQTIKLEIGSEVSEQFQDFLVQIIERSSKLQKLRLSRRDTNDRLYEKVTGLQNITKNLKEFTWFAENVQDSTNIVSSTEFSTKLQTLRINYSDLELHKFQLMMNSVRQNLKTLILTDCNFPEMEMKDFQLEIFKIVVQKLRNLETLNVEFLESTQDHFFESQLENELPHWNLKRLLLSWCSQYNLLSGVSSLTSLIKWFPNLNLVSLCFGDEDQDSRTVGVGIKFHEAVRVLSGLKMLKDLCLRICGNSAPGDLPETFKAFKDIPTLLCCTLVEFGFDNVVGDTIKTTYSLGDLQDDLVGALHMNFIRLIGFKFDHPEDILEFANAMGVSLEVYARYKPNYDIDDDFWLMTLTGRLSKESFLA